MLTFVTICQNRTCLKDGSPQVLEAFTQALDGISEVALTASGCLGQCGSGPTVIVQSPNLPVIWYSGVWPEAAGVIVQRHIVGGRPVWELMSKTRHPHARREYGPPEIAMVERVLSFLHKNRTIR
ncbi:(2Fe-2S) ferredoxin domain-containing protein [Anthocerotibacter panamensis]|uniref:(2Fe-2S) ferredoxin domain-containing protein n=1 Tax=Anthocerotibacter panamensis TaxID=2857077 RepID=UPI001C405CAD|nr:(2Fe-2S) ferredoxin domain-containing protein [Anthocerotibacter panamensis]